LHSFPTRRSSDLLLPACTLVPGSTLKLMSLTILNQFCQSCRSTSIQRSSCSCPCRARSCSSRGTSLVLAKVPVHWRIHSSCASSVCFTDACQASTVFVQSSGLAVPLKRCIVSSQFVNSFCCD